MIARFLSSVSRELSKLKQHTKQPYNNILSHTSTYTTITTIGKTKASNFEVRVISRDIIKPSSSPRHQNTFNLSLIDQVSPPLYNPILLFYRNDPSNPINQLQQSMLLKKSLSDTLVDYYPLAGRIRGNVCIECNDGGVEFSEARVSEELMYVIQTPKLEDLSKLLPFQSIPRHHNMILSVQVNYFHCGGVAISACISHKISDALACINFLKAWATKAQGHVDNVDLLVKTPIFNAASLFPPVGGEWSARLAASESLFCHEKLASKRILFNKKKIEQLKAKVGDDNASQVKDPTRVEVICAYIWKMLLNAAVANPGFTKITAALLAVNLRARLVPEIQEDVFGNVFWLTTTQSLSNSGQTKYPDLIHMLRKAIKTTDNAHMTPFLKGNQSILELSKELERLFDEGDKCLFTSLCRFPLYQVNFGMGEPTWAWITTLPMKNLVILCSTKCGQGIEAWIYMLEDDIAILDHLNLDKNIDPDQ